MIRFVSFIGRTHATGCPIQGKPSRPDRSIASCAEMARTCQPYRLPRLPSLVQRSAQGTQPGAVLISDRKSVVSGKSVSVRVDLGGRRIIKKKRARRTDTEKRNRT